MGLLVPLSGRLKAAGEQLLAGALEGAEPGAAGGVQLVIRDSATNAAKAARELLEQRGVRALVGTLNPAAARAVAAEAAGHGVPFVVTAPRMSGTRPAPTSLRLVHPNRDRVSALLGHAARTGGARKLCILAPTHKFGAAMARWARAAARDLGLKVIAEVTYPAGTHSFTAQARKLAKLRFDALLVPDTGRALSLLAPALAREGLWASGQTISSGKDRRRRVWLLATADGLGSRDLATASRYLEGAVMAPGFLPDPGDPATGAAAAAMAASLGRPPTLLEALARDGVVLLRGDLKRGPTGLTGPLRFDDKGARSSTPNLYTVKDGKVSLLKE